MVLTITGVCADPRFAWDAVALERAELPVFSCLAEVLTDEQCLRIPVCRNLFGGLVLVVRSLAEECHNYLLVESRLLHETVITVTARFFRAVRGFTASVRKPFRKICGSGIFRAFRNFRL